jgi:lysophospholipase L1-like esterase
MKRLGLAVCTTIALLMSLTACSRAASRVPLTSADANAKPTTLVTIGGSATEGDGVPDRYRQAWPYLLFHEAFPLSTSLVNAALDGATVANAPVEQVPVAQEVKPDVVAVWLGADDLSGHSPVGQFAAGLRTVIEDLRAAGVHRILVADLPSAYGDVSPYDAAIRDVVRSTKTTLVDIQDAAITIAPGDRFAAQPDVASQRVIADAFEQGLRATP